MSVLRDDILQLMRHPDYRVTITRIGKSRFQSNYKFEKDCHSEREINVVLSGCCIMELQHEYVPLKEGDCIIIRPYELHSCMVDMSKNCTIIQLKYTVTIPAELENRIPAFSTEQPYYKVASCDEVGNILEHLIRNSRMNYEERSVVTDFILAQLYAQLSKEIRHYSGTLKEDASGVEKDILDYINLHYDEDLNLEHMAKKYHVSSRYIRKFFEKNVGMNCMQYITLLRIGKAKGMLGSTERNITEIAMEVGFHSSQYFSRVFRNYVGMTAGEYRANRQGVMVEEDEYEEL